MTTLYATPGLGTCTITFAKGPKGSYGLDTMTPSTRQRWRGAADAQGVTTLPEKLVLLGVSTAMLPAANDPTNLELKPAYLLKDADNRLSCDQARTRVIRTCSARILNLNGE